MRVDYVLVGPWFRWLLHWDGRYTMKATFAQNRFRRWLGVVFSSGCFLVLLAWASAAGAAGVRVLPPDKLPADQRLEKLQDLNGYFPFTPAKSREEWEHRAERLRRQMLVALGLWPMPSKTPANAVIHGCRDQGDYTVEKAYFESFPGFFVTGNLYRPKGKSGKLPGVLCPHGHWANGRFYDVGVDGVRKQIVQGAERFENGGRSPLQSRCVQLARMGCVVFHYDMIGYADSVQISQSLAHGFSKQRPEMNTAENWGLFSPAAESHLQSVMGMQAYDSFRALDFLLDLPDVDPQRIAVTGASGGGTQTFILSATGPARHRFHPGRDGLDGHARRLHVRECQSVAGGDRQRRVRGAVRPQTAVLAVGRRLDQGNAHQGLPATAGALPAAGRRDRTCGTIRCCTSSTTTTTSAGPTCTPGSTSTSIWACRRRSSRRTIRV